MLRAVVSNRRAIEVRVSPGWTTQATGVGEGSGVGDGVGVAETRGDAAVLPDGEGPADEAAPEAWGVEDADGPGAQAPTTRTASRTTSPAGS